jgi:putative transcriptional regulator
MPSSAAQTQPKEAMPKKYRSKICAVVHETATGLLRSGGLDMKTMREFDVLCLTPVQKMSPRKIRALRTREKASQTVFAAYLNVTPGLISKWERGEKRPQGASRKLLSLVDKKGLDVVA